MPLDVEEHNYGDWSRNMAVLQQLTSCEIGLDTAACFNKYDFHEYSKSMKNEKGKYFRGNWGYTDLSMSFAFGMSASF